MISPERSDASQSCGDALRITAIATDHQRREEIGKPCAHQTGFTPIAQTGHIRFVGFRNFAVDRRQ